MGRQRVIRPGQSRRDLPDNQLGLPLRDFGRRLSPTTAPVLAARGTHTAAGAERVAHLAATLARLEADHGPEVAAHRYLDAPEPERRDRIAAAVTASLLHRTDPDLLAARDGHRPKNRTARPMSELEQGAVRIGTWSWPLRAINVAIAEAGAVPGQHIHLEPDDLWLQSDRWHVPLPKNRGVVQRTVALAPWVNPLAEQAIRTAQDDGHRLCLTTPHVDRERDRKNVTATLDRALSVAGVNVTATSVRLTSGHLAYDTGGMQAAVAALGVTSERSARRLLSL